MHSEYISGIKQLKLITLIRGKYFKIILRLGLYFHGWQKIRDLYCNENALMKEYN